MKFELSKYSPSWMPALRKLRQGDFEFKAYKGCTVRLSSNNDNNDEQTISRQMSLLLYVIPLCDPFSLSCRSRNSKA